MSTAFVRSVEEMVRRPRHRRKKMGLAPHDPDAFVSMSLDVPRWLLERLEAEAETHRLSRAAIASEWLELHAISTDPSRRIR